jgi:hypothetical protein
MDGSFSGPRIKSRSGSMSNAFTEPPPSFARSARSHRVFEWINSVLGLIPAVFVLIFRASRQAGLLGKLGNDKINAHNGGTRVYEPGRTCAPAVGGSRHHEICTIRSRLEVRTCPDDYSPRGTGLIDLGTQPDGRS